MKTTRFDTTWYVDETREAAEAALRIQNDQWIALHSVGFLYVVEFSSGIVKVGKGTDPNGRLAAHDRGARVHGGCTRSTWTSRQICGYASAERELVRLCSQVGAPVAGREYFAVGFETARSFGVLIESNRVAASELPTDARMMLGGAA